MLLEAGLLGMGSHGPDWHTTAETRGGPKRCELASMAATPATTPHACLLAPSLPLNPGPPRATSSSQLCPGAAGTNGSTDQAGT